jgi:hypothetical protein
MRWTVPLEARTDQEEVKMTGLVTFERPAGSCTLAETKALLSTQHARLSGAHVDDYAGAHVPASHAGPGTGIPARPLLSGAIHQRATSRTVAVHPVGDLIKPVAS